MYTPLLFIGGLGGWEVLLIVTIVLLLFGAKRIPELARGLGSGIREFKSATTEHLKEKEEASESKEVTPDSGVQEKHKTEDTPVHHQA